MAGVNIVVISAPLPEGWEGTPDEFRALIFSTLTFQASGAFLSGQIGGAMPTADVGLFIEGAQLFTWDPDTSAYRPADTHPIGSCLPHLGATVPDTRYLLLDGTDYLRADYPVLAAMLGSTYNRASDPSDRFRVPDMRGRDFRGAGIGDYDPKQEGTPGRMLELTLGDYGGREWPVRKITKHINQPAAAVTPGDSLIYSGVKHASLYTRAVPPYVVCNWIVRAK